MATKSPELSTSDPIMYGPSTVYADALAQLAMGPFVSKLTFGVDRKTGETLTPVQTITMPTPALIALALQVMSVLNTPTLRATFKADIDKYLSQLTGDKAA